MHKEWIQATLQMKKKIEGHVLLLPNLIVLDYIGDIIFAKQKKKGISNAKQPGKLKLTI